MSRGERIIAVISRDRRAETVRVYRKTPRRRTARSTSARASRNADDETRRSKESREETTREEHDDDDDDDDDASSSSVRASFLRAIVANESLGTRLVSLSRVGTGTGTGTAGAEPRDAVDALASRLGSSCATGLEDASRVERNRAAYGANAARGRAAKTTLDFAREALEDPTLIALAVSGAASLLLETRLVATRGGDADEPAWLNGAVILLAVFVVVVECVNNEQKQRAFMNLNAASEETSLASVTRAGARTLVPRRDVVVGDVVDLQAGDVSPADALVCESADFLVDQSHITGESDESKKRPGDVVFAGSRVTSGRGSALSVAVGETSSCGEIAEMIGVGGDEDATPLQRRLQKLAFDIGSYGVAAAACVGTILAWKTTVDAVGGTISGAETTVGYLDDIIVAVTIIVVSVPEVRFSTPLAFFFCFFAKSFVRFQNDDGRSVMIGVLGISQREFNSLTRQTRVFADFLLTNAAGCSIFLVDVLRLDDDLSIGNLSETRASLKRKHSVCRLPSERRRRRFDFVRRDESLTATEFYHFRRDYRSP